MKQLLLTSAAIVWISQGLAGAADKVDFAKDIQPIFQQNCIKCHGPEKQKGKYRLDSKATAFKETDNGPTITAGDAGKSDLYRRITLPKGNDDIMPNEGDPLTKAQTDLIRDWINQGAVWSAASASAKPGETSSAAPKRAPDFKPSGAEQKAVAKLEAMGMAVRPIAANLNWREANLRLQGTNVTDATLAVLKDVASLIELNLATTRITDAGLVHIAGLTNLESLNLSQTAVTDAGLKHLKRLGKLESLNLYSTAVTDAGLAQLKGLAHLQKLYVWQTKVTDAGVKALQAALPKADVNTGWDLSTLVKKEEKKDEKKEEKKEEKK
jgi:mono/diheme cytochrome c family protein